jgi:hypothetical protein
MFMHVNRTIIHLILLLMASSSLCAQEDRVGMIVSAEASPHYKQRHHLLHTMSPADLRTASDRLFTFMADGQSPEHMNEGDYLSLCNDIYDLLFALGINQPQLLAHALKVIPDENRMLVWRDYCIQKMAETLAAEGIDEAARQQGIQLLSELASGRFPGLQGTALIVAHELSQRPAFVAESGLSMVSIGQKALQCAQDSSAELIDRVTALQIATRCATPGTLEYVRSTLSDELPAEPMLKVSSIAAVGVLGTPEDSVLLSAYRQSPDIRYRKAARSALKNLE